MSWLAWVVVLTMFGAFGAGIGCGWTLAQPLSDSLRAAVLRRRLRLLQAALEAEREMWRGNQTLLPVRRWP